MIAADFLAILCCPENRQPLALAEPNLITDLNARIAAGTLTNRGGEAVREPLTEGLVRRDGTVLYAVRDGIPILLVEEGIFL